MPNWCSNVVVLSHPNREMLEKVKTGLTGKGLMNEFMPIPEELTKLDAPNRSDDVDALIKKYGWPDWYTWCISNWGTKWDVTSESVEFVGDNLEFSFESAWSPPIAFYEKLQEMGFLVDAKYFEPGMAYVGTFYDGNDECYDYSGMNSEEVAEELPEDLNEFFQISNDLAMWEEENPDEE